MTTTPSKSRRNHQVFALRNSVCLPPQPFKSQSARYLEQKSSTWSKRHTDLANLRTKFPAVSAIKRIRRHCGSRSDILAVQHISRAPQLMKRLLHTLVPPTGEPPLLDIPKSFSDLLSFTSEIIDPRRMLGFLEGEPVPIIVTKFISIGQPAWFRLVNLAYRDLVLFEF